MRRTIMKKFIFIGLAVLVVLGGCSLFNRDFYRNEAELYDPTKGQLDIVINGSSIATKTITPNMDVDEYVLHFVNSDIGEEFWRYMDAGDDDFPVYSESGFTPSDPVGELDWSVDITAKNSDGVTIGANGGAVATPHLFTIAAGSEATINIDVIPINSAADGPLRVFVSWPDAAGSAEALTATLTDISGNDPTVHEGGLESFLAGFHIDPPGTALRTAEFYSVDNGENIPVGYYTMILKLIDGERLLWGRMETVRIVGFLPTDSGNTKFALQLSPSGSVLWDGITHTYMNNPVGIAFNQSIEDPPVTVSVDTTVIATLTLPVPPSTSYDYIWYLDGDPTSDFGDNFNPLSVSPDYTIVVANFATDPGVHNLSLLITGRSSAGGAIETLSSENFPFTIP
jgi:hypothetical protein